ncbi:BCCT family transporter [Oceanimonas marisflavi]|uniref:BCCT family transporter n=1 Tax=Oceanimonas marisflavi TaxID=2059724 RepID=UPI000D31736B|nr:BCCT family transporter [Oceanimonas marisflavi]
MKRNFSTTVATVVTIIVLIGFAALAPEPFQALLNTIKLNVIGNLGFIFTYPAFVISVAFVLLMLTPLGNLRFGKGAPEFSTLSWLGMLFATGMGIGLVTWGVLEPRYHVEAGNSTDQALLYAFNHWGLLAWAGYLAIGALFAHAMYNLNIAKPAETLLGGGFLSKVNLVSLVVSTVIGLSLTFSYAAEPLQQSLAQFLGVDVSATLIIIVLTGFAIASSASGLNRGIKWLSNYNTLFALVLLFSVFLLTSPGEILSTFTRLLPDYLWNYPAMATETGQGDPERKAWLADWLYAFEASWYGWFIFTGVFIARISKGRTLRQLVMGVMLMPSLLSCLWFTVFGLGGLEMEAQDVFALMASLDQYGVLSFILTLNILLFFVTSSDSAGLVCEMLTVERSRAFWIVAMASLAIVINWLDGDIFKVILTLISVAAIPVAFGLFTVGVAFLLRLRQEHMSRQPAETLAR